MWQNFMHKHHPEEFPSNHNIQAHTLQTKPWTFYIKNHLFLTETQDLTRNMIYQMRKDAQTALRLRQILTVSYNTVLHHCDK
jgi:hypothetical protein